MPLSTPHKPITSKDNETVKRLRSLSDAKHRKKEQAFLIEGVKTVEEALRDNAGVKMIIAAPSLTLHHGKAILKMAESRNVEILWVSEKILDAISESKTPQPVIAVVRMQQHSGEALLASPIGLVVLCHQLQDPGNLGTIIRTAEAAGAAGVAITPNTVDPYNAKTVRASMGSILRLPVAKIGDAVAFAKKCEDAKFQVVALALDSKSTHFDLDLKKPTAIIVGQEGSGLPDDILKAADIRIRIPMAEGIESLNVATSVAVVLYEGVRQRTRG